MREKLKAYIDEKRIFSGIVCKYGVIHENDKPTLLLMNIKDYKGDSVCDHVWIEVTKPVERAFLMFGDKIKFIAVVIPYEKKHGWDYGFVGVNYIRKIGKVQQIPTFA
jgi:hypothetical protein